MNDEEQTILNELADFSKEDRIKILTDSISADDNENNRHTLSSLLLKLKEA
jgi:hypothetical protein